MAKQRERKQTTGKTTNQYTFDPREEDAWNNFINRESNTYSNAYLSAIKAGFGKGHAKQITTQQWWLAKARRSGLLSKAEKVLDEDLGMETVVPVIGMFGPIIDKETKKPLEKIDPDLRRIRQSSATFIASRLGKSKGYSTRTEMTGADGKDLPAPIFGGSAK